MNISIDSPLYLYLSISFWLNCDSHLFIYCSFISLFLKTYHTLLMSSLVSSLDLDSIAQRYNQSLSNSLNFLAFSHLQNLQLCLKLFAAFVWISPHIYNQRFHTIIHKTNLLYFPRTISIPLPKTSFYLAHFPLTLSSAPQLSGSVDDFAF